MPHIDDLKDKITTYNQVVEDWFTPPMHFGKKKRKDPFKLQKS